MIDNIEFIDLATTKKITGGNENLALQMIELFAEEIPEYKEGLLKAERENDLDRIGKLIHKFLGSCAICTAPCIKEQLTNLSYAYEQKEPNLLEHIIKLNDAIDRTLEFCEENNLGTTSD